MAISSKELAEKLNISAATVSMVLNNKPGISAETRDRVINAAKRYGFDFSKFETEASPSVILLLIYKKNGIIVADTPFFSQLTEGIDSMCRKHGYALQIQYIYESSKTPAQIIELSDNECSGILLLGTEMQLQDIELFNKISKPLIVLDTYFNECDRSFVTINNISGMFRASEYLISLGHSSIGYLRSSQNIVNFTERFSGYMCALKKHSIDYDKRLVHYLNPTTDGAYSDMKSILKNNSTLAGAYIADNDLIAAGAMRALKEQGYKIPEDISIIGFDNMPLCDITEPPLTTIAVPKQQFGALAAEQLIDQIIDGNGLIMRTQLSPTLIERKSTGSLINIEGLHTCYTGN